MRGRMPVVSPSRIDQKEHDVPQPDNGPGSTAGIAPVDHPADRSFDAPGDPLAVASLPAPPPHPAPADIADPDQRGRPAHRAVVRRESAFRRSLAIADMLAAGIALVLCVTVLGDDGLTAVALLALPLMVVAGRAHGLYERDEMLINKTTLDQAPQLFQCATLYALLVYLLQPYFLDGGVLDAAQVLVLWGTLFVGAVVARRIARWFARATTCDERCLFVGTEASYMRLQSKLPEDGKWATLVGRMSLTPVHDDRVDDVAVRTLHHLIEDLDVQRVIIEPSEAAPETTLEFVREAKATSVRVSLLPRILEVVGSTIEVDDVNGLTLLGVRRFGLSRSSRVTKRVFDTTGAALGLVLLSPALLAISVLIRFDSTGGVIFRQLRVGRDGQPFEVWKFRTMVRGADALKAQLQARNEAAAGLFKIDNDPRVTRAGRWLRRTSLDELPQLVNVLLGEMSLVGPRPLVLDEDRQITGLDRRRLHLTPGMTGHWQIAGSSKVPLSEMVKLDYLYVAGWSLWADVRILLRTGLHVLARRGV